MNEINNLIQQLHNREWLSKILRKLRVKPLTVGFFVIIFNLVVNLSIAAYTNTFISSSTNIGFLNDYVTWAFLFLFQPSILGVYCWLQTSSQQLFGQLIRDGGLDVNSDLINPLTKLRDRLKNKKVIVFAVLFGIFQAVISFFLIGLSNQLWSASHPLITWTRMPMDFLIFYIIGIGFYDFIVILIAMNDIMRNQKVNVQPYHPDRAGGMAAIGRFVSNIGYGIAPLGLMVLMLIFQLPEIQSVYYRNIVIIIIAIYLLAAPVCFFLPLLAAHSVMATFRDEHIKKVSSEFDNAFSKLSSLNSRETDQVEKLLKIIRQLTEEREIISQFPVWPFNPANFRKFFGLVLSPVVPIITSVVIDIILGMI